MTQTRLYVISQERKEEQSKINTDCILIVFAGPDRRFLLQRRSRLTRSLTKDKSEFRIFNGDESDITKYPFTVSVYSKSYDAIIGSGAILNHNWILVSAFEVHGVTADDLIVRAGSNYSNNEGQEFNVSKIVVHDLYKDQYWYDIALLKTETKIAYSRTVKRIGLGYYTPKPNSTAVMSGFGESTELDGTLRAGTMTVFTKAKCKEYYSDLPVTLFCGASDTYTPSALDDFGNPLVQNKVLVGSYLGRLADGPDVFNNIVEWKDWIVENIKNHNK